MSLPDMIPFDETEWIYPPPPGMSLAFFDNQPHRRTVADFNRLPEPEAQHLAELGFTTLQLRTMIAHAENVIAIATAALRIKEGRNQ